MLLRRSRSLLLSGMADVWSAVHERVGRRNESAGLLLMVVSAASFAAMAAFAKKLLPATPPQAVVLSRGVLLGVVFVIAARRLGVPLLGRRPAMLLARGLLGYVALSCYFYSVQHLPLGDAVLLQYSHPVFIALLAPLVLGERMPGADLVLVLLALAGVGMIVRPAGAVRPEALIGAIGSLFSGFAYMSVRVLSRTEHPAVILVWFPLATVPPSLVLTLRSGARALPASASELLGHALVTVAALLGQLALTHGLARAGAARATAVTLIGPVFGLGFGYLLFGTVPTVASAAGMVTVLGALGLLGWRAKNRATAGAAGAAATSETPSRSTG